MEGEFVPVGDVLRQLVLALGAAMVVGSVAVLIRERTRKEEDDRPRPNMRVVALNIAIGTVLAVWGFASLFVF